MLRLLINAKWEKILYTDLPTNWSKNYENSSGISFMTIDTFQNIRFLIAKMHILFDDNSGEFTINILLNERIEVGENKNRFLRGYEYAITLIEFKDLFKAALHERFPAKTDIFSRWTEISYKHINFKPTKDKNLLKATLETVDEFIPFTMVNLRELFTFIDTVRIQKVEETIVSKVESSVTVETGSTQSAYVSTLTMWKTKEDAVNTGLELGQYPAPRPFSF